MKVPVFVPTRSLPQKARRGGVWGCVIALQTPLQFRYPRRGACARKSPNLVAELCVAPRRGGVGVGRCVSPTAASGTPTPAPDLVVPCSSPKLPSLVPSGAGRLLRSFRLAVDVCFALLNGLPARRGRRGRLVPPKTERGNSESNEFALKLPRSVFRLWRASPPIH